MERNGEKTSGTEDEKSFAELLDESFVMPGRLAPGQKVTATVVKITADWVFLDLGRKGEGCLDRKELAGPDGVTAVKEGDTLQAYFKGAEGSELRFTTKIAGGAAGHSQLEDAWRGGIPVEGLVERLRELVPALSSGSLEEMKAEIRADQEAYFAVLVERPARALDIARATLRKLDRVCPRHPQDAELQFHRGYTHKNVAQALVRLGRPDEAGSALAVAERTFRTAVAGRTRDAGAWNGLGSVAAVRGEYRAALKLVRKALKLEPNYPAAREDERSLLEALGRATPRRRVRAGVA